MGSLKENIEKGNLLLKSAKEELQSLIVGQQDLIDSLFVALLADGHVLLEGLPGLAKTLAVRSFAETLGCGYKRVQFTPDLLPADLLGTSVYHPKEGSFSIHKGPLFTNILLADEINRAPPKVQAALLEVMQEKQITIGGETFKTEAPYMVLATQNPIEQEGTYPLPEAQIDRFMMKVLIQYPSWKEEEEIVKRVGHLKPRATLRPRLDAKAILELRGIVEQIFIDERITHYILDLVFATRTPSKYGLKIAPMIYIGASPRASLALVLCAKAHAFLKGREYVVPDDVKKVAIPVLRHRIKRSFEAEAEGISSDRLIGDILEKLPLP